MIKSAAFLLLVIILVPVILVEAKLAQPNTVMYNLREGDKAFYYTTVDPYSLSCQLWMIEFSDIFPGAPDAAYVVLYMPTPTGWNFYDSRIINEGASIPETSFWLRTDFDSFHWLTASSTSSLKTTSPTKFCYWLSLPIVYNNGQSFFSQSFKSETLTVTGNPYP